MCMIDFNITNRRHHCRYCGKSVCQKCSTSKRYLSKSDKKTLHRICDYCDTKLSNFKVIFILDKHFNVVRVKSEHYHQSVA